MIFFSPQLFKLKRVILVNCHDHSPSPFYTKRQFFGKCVLNTSWLLKNTYGSAFTSVTSTEKGAMCTETQDDHLTGLIEIGQTHLKFRKVNDGVKVLLSKRVIIHSIHHFVHCFFLPTNANQVKKKSAKAKDMKGHIVPCQHAERRLCKKPTLGKLCKGCVICRERRGT